MPTRVRQAKLTQDKTQVQEYRYVIKVMSVKRKGGTEPEVREDQRPKDVPALLIGR